MQMYKVFINEKKISLGTTALQNIKSLPFENSATIEIAIDLMDNTSTLDVHLFHHDLEMLWKTFSSMFKNVEAAGGIVHNKENEILFIKRLGKWDLPKGKIEKGELPKDAAVREVQEETGIDELFVEKFIQKTYHIYKEKNQKRILKTTHWYRMQFLGTTLAIPQIEEGITEVDWKNRSQINLEVFSNTFRNINLIINTMWENESS